MRILYIDESGSTEAPDSRSGATPVMVIAGIAIDHNQLPTLTEQFLELKARFYPGLAPTSSHRLDRVLSEVKGSDLRASVRSTSRNDRRAAIGFLNQTLRLLTAHDADLIGRIWVKEPGKALKPRETYTFSIQDSARHFEHLLAQNDDIGLIVCDGRSHDQDAQVAHSIFTQKHRQAGDNYPHIVEASVFGRSVNHIGLQLADIIASALLFPLATRTYCPHLPQGTHTASQFDVLKERFGAQLQSLQHLYTDHTGRVRGGVVVSDPVGRHASKYLFGSNQPTPASV